MVADSGLDDVGDSNWLLDYGWHLVVVHLSDRSVDNWGMSDEVAKSTAEESDKDDLDEETINQNHIAN